MSYTPQSFGEQKSSGKMGKNKEEIVEDELPKPAFLDGAAEAKISERIGKEVMDKIGPIKDFFKLEVKYLYPNRYRVNVITEYFSSPQDLFASRHRPFSTFVKEINGKFEYDPPLVRKQS